MLSSVLWETSSRGWVAREGPTLLSEMMGGEEPSFGGGEPGFKRSGRSGRRAGLALAAAAPQHPCDGNPGMGNRICKLAKDQQ